MKITLFRIFGQVFAVFGCLGVILVSLWWGGLLFLIGIDILMVAKISELEDKIRLLMNLEGKQTLKPKSLKFDPIQPPKQSPKVRY